MVARDDAAMRAQRICATVGCAGTSHSTYCSACAVGRRPGPRSKSQASTYLEARGGSGSRWQQIRIEVFERDDFTCVLCGFTAAAPQLRADHIISGTRALLENLRTLCVPCHKAITEGGGG